MANLHIIEGGVGNHLQFTALFDELLKKNNINKGIYKFGWYLNNEKKF